MSAKIITFGISKGGCSKSTSSGITAWILSREHRVLCIDMDGQGNLTSFLTGEFDLFTAFSERTSLEAILEGDVSPYIVNVSKNLDIVPSNDFLANLSKLMAKRRLGTDALTTAIEPVLDDYDYIIIDTPPSLGEQTIVSLSAYSPGGSYPVVMFDGSMFCFYAVPKFLEIIETAKERHNPNIEVAGILFAIIDGRVKETTAMVELMNENYPNLKFDTIITRKAATRRLPIYGFENNSELDNAIEHYLLFVEELKQRVETKRLEKSNQ